MSGYVKTFKVQDGGKDKNIKLISFRADDEKLLEKCKTIWTKIEDLRNIKLNSFAAYDDRYIKTKIRIYGEKVCRDFRGLNVPENCKTCESFTIIPVDPLHVSKSK